MYTDHTIPFLIIIGIGMWLMATIPIGIFIAWKNTRRHEKLKREMPSNDFE